MSRHLPTPPLDSANLIAQHRRPPHTPAIAPKPASATSLGASIGLALLRCVAPGVARWYAPRRQLIHNQLQKLVVRARPEPAQAPKVAPRTLRFRSS